MPSDLARVIARILDGQRPQATGARGRTLQLFVAGDEAMAATESAAATVRTASGTPYGTGRYGVVVYGE